MAKKKRSAAKRPPAHEVILTRLQEFEAVLERVSHKQKWARTVLAANILVCRDICGELLRILEQMHLPEKEESKILATLRALKTDAIGVHPSHVRLLKKLSGHSPEHVMGKTAKLKRRRA